MEPDPGPGPWKTWTQKNLGLEKPGPWKTWTHKNLDSQKPGLWKFWTMKNAGNNWMQKKRLEDHMVWFINIENLLRKALPVEYLSQLNIYNGGFPQKYLTVKSH